jgi:hypothetical protein
MRRSTIALLSLTVTGLLASSACSSDVKRSVASKASGVSTSLAPEDLKVPDATVTAGLAQMPKTIAAAIAAIGTPDAKEKADAIETLWASFEGTVREKESTIYLAIEDQLTPLQRAIEQGDASAASSRAAALATLFAQYLTKHP